MALDLAKDAISAVMSCAPHAMSAVSFVDSKVKDALSTEKGRSVAVAAAGFAAGALLVGFQWSSRRTEAPDKDKGSIQDRKSHRTAQRALQYVATGIPSDASGPIVQLIPGPGGNMPRIRPFAVHKRWKGAYLHGFEMRVAFE